MPHDPNDATVPHQPSADDALSTNSGEPRFGTPAAQGELGRLAGYRVLRQLGKGGMGAVYLALDEGLRRQVALKIMLPKFAADPLAKERFLREARAAAAVRNDHVVTIYQVGEDRGVPFIAMDYLSGYPLDSFLKQKGRLTIPQAVRVGLEVATGLAAAHSLGLVHRDIKPANLWLESPQGRIKILDFGLARNADGNSLAAEVTATGVVVGTPAFMSPEQARGEAVDHRSDLFSLGAVLYHLTTGKLPFERPTVMAMMIALATEEPVPVQSLNPEVPPPFAALIHQLLAKRVDARPASAAEVVNTLRAMEYALANPNAMASMSQPQVVYVPIQVTAPEHQPNLDAFANLDTPGTTEATQLEPSRTEVEAAPVQPRRGLPAWAVVVGLFLLGGGLAGGFMLLKKPREVAKTQPADPGQQDPTPTPKPEPPKPTYPVLPTQEANRRLAQWVLDGGGGVVLKNGQALTSVKEPAKLPQGPLNFTGFDMYAGSKHRVTDNDLDLLRNTTVAMFSFGGPTDITDRGLEKLGEMGLGDQLTTVMVLDAPQVTDEGLRFLGRLPKLSSLAFQSPRITDAGLEHLKALPELAMVHINNTGITDAGLTHLAACPKLGFVTLKRTKSSAPRGRWSARSTPGARTRCSSWG